MATLKMKSVAELEQNKKEFQEKIRAIDAEIRIKKSEDMASAAKKLADKNPAFKAELEKMGVKFETKVKTKVVTPKATKK